MGLDPLHENQLGHWPKFQKLHIHSLCTPGGRNWAYFALCTAVSEIGAGFQNSHIWIWNLAIDQSSRSCKYTLFLPRESKLSLFLLYGQLFLRYWAFFKLAILGHETWPLAKVQEVAQIFFLSQEVEIELIFTLRAVVSKTRAIFKITIFGHETYTLFLPQGVEIELIVAVSKIWAEFHECHFGHECHWLITTYNCVIAFQHIGNKYNWQLCVCLWAH